jgi:hypothetical protein
VRSWQLILLRGLSTAVQNGPPGQVSAARRASRRCAGSHRALTGPMQDAMEGDVDCCQLDHIRAARFLETLRKSLIPRRKRIPLGAAKIVSNKAAVRGLDPIPNWLTCRPLIELRAKMLPTASDGDAPTDVQMETVADFISIDDQVPHWNRIARVS